MIPVAKSGGRPGTLDMRQVINAILFIVVGGIQWRMLPKEYQKWQSVYYYFRIVAHALPLAGGVTGMRGAGGIPPPVELGCGDDSGGVLQTITAVSADVGTGHGESGATAGQADTIAAVVDEAAIGDGHNARITLDIQTGVVETAVAIVGAGRVRDDHLAVKNIEAIVSVVAKTVTTDNLAVIDDNLTPTITHANTAIHPDSCEIIPIAQGHIIQVTSTLEGGVQKHFAALQLYRGNFLDGLFVDDSPDFELWLLTERERCRQQAIGLLERLIVHHLHGGDYPQAQNLTARLLTLQPDMEAVHRQMMWLLAKNDQHQVALTQYENYCRYLADELDAAPSPETTALFEALQQGQVKRFGLLFLNPASPIPNIQNPYRGLHTFTEVDASFFFGREATTDRLQSMVGHSSLVAVIGASGSGKSSLVNAGLLPPLHATGDWLITKFRPGDQPFHTLASALTILLPSGLPEADHLAEHLYQGELTLPTIVRQIQPSQRLLVVIDQFEELYTLCDKPQRRQKFLDSLLSITSHQPPANSENHSDYSVPTCTIVLTMRADFMEQALSYRPFADTLQANTFILGPMAGHTGVVWRISFSSDGHTLISAGDDARIISWNVNPQLWHTLACNITRRNLTAIEWQLYLGGEPFRTTCDFSAASPTLPIREP